MLVGLGFDLLWPVVLLFVLLDHLPREKLRCFLHIVKAVERARVEKEKGGAG